MSTAAPIRIGVVGLRGRGSYLAQQYHRPPEMAVTALCDTDPDAFDARPERTKGLEAARYTDLDTMLREETLDWVLLATPDRTHHALTLKILRAGVHLFLEKPMCQTVDEADEIVRAVDETGRNLVVGCELRYAEPVEQFRALLREGTIGRILHGTCIDSIERGFSYFLRDYRKKKFSHGLLMQKGIHSIDLINDFVNSEPVRVFADGGLDYFGSGGAEREGLHCRDCGETETCPYYAGQIPSWSGDFLVKGEHARDHCVWDPTSDVEDNTVCVVNYASGVRLSYTEVHFAPDYRREFHFIGTEGRLSLVLDQTPMEGDSVDLQEEGREARITLRRRRQPPEDIPTSSPGGSHWGADDRMRDHLIEAIRQGGTIEPGVRAGRASVAVAAAALRSIETGLPVEIPRI